MDDIEYLAFSTRPRDLRDGPFTIPDARMLGRRLRALRFLYGLSVADVADASSLRYSVVQEFEDFGAVSGESLIWLIEVLCHDDSLCDAFLYPNFMNREDLLSRGRGGEGSSGERSDNV